MKQWLALKDTWVSNLFLGHWAATVTLWAYGLMFLRGLHAWEKNSSLLRSCCSLGIMSSQSLDPNWIIKSQQSTANWMSFQLNFKYNDTVKVQEYVTQLAVCKAISPNLQITRCKSLNLNYEPSLLFRKRWIFHKPSELFDWWFNFNALILKCCIPFTVCEVNIHHHFTVSKFSHFICSNPLQWVKRGERSRGRVEGE